MTNCEKGNLNDDEERELRDLSEHDLLRSVAKDVKILKKLVGGIVPEQCVAHGLQIKGLWVVLFLVGGGMITAFIRHIWPH